ncbi:MAG: DEAD/DEAH box helicase family protein [Pyramidobacter sp.]|nr:DEAD/DEAH box helicase family protein [Pyramidobacter sp.]
MLMERSRSGKGAHIWIFFDSPIDAVLARRFGFTLLEKGAESVNLKSFRFYDRMLPAQDFLTGSAALGNLIALPLQGRALKDGNSAFVDDNWNVLPDQWLALRSTPKLSRLKLEEYLRAWNLGEAADTAAANERYEGDGPWNRSRSFHHEDVSGMMHVHLSDRIYIDSANLRPRLQNQLRRLAAFPNPIFYRNQTMKLSNWAQPRFIYMGEDDGGFICLPRGLIEEVKCRCQADGIACGITDRRQNGKPLKIEFMGVLRDKQKNALDCLTQHDCGILSAATAFGKTVVCAALIARKKVNTLIVLESSALIEQWEKALNAFLHIDEEPPEYRTRTGRVKKRRSLIGVIQGAKDTSGGLIDIAMAGSLRKKGEFHERLGDYGLVIVDECHHSASETVAAVLQKTPARFLYGVTATPFRSDGLERINVMLLGPVRFQYTAKEKAAEGGLPHWVVPRFTSAVCPHGRERLHIAAAYEIIRENGLRDEQIRSDVRACVNSGRTPLVLTKFTEHAARLCERLKNDAQHVFLLVGTMSQKGRRKTLEEIVHTSANESIIVVATGQLIGEGFDFPRLDTLILAAPVAWKGVVEQYAGRLARDYPGKKDVMIYDYIDAHIPVFEKMYAKRLKAYARIGYQLRAASAPAKQEANAIFDADNYYETFTADLRAAAKSVVISSPSLAADKTRRLAAVMKERLQAGVKVTVVTWHPDVYRYGRDEHRIEQMETLRSAGCEVVLTRENCQRFAVIDEETVWYGSMNLLSMEYNDECVLRVCDKTIAAELLEMTFSKEAAVKEFALPLT